MSQVAILLSTYNGERFLTQQLQSIQNQDFKDWTLFCRDDGSTDKTRDVLKKFASLETRIHFLENDQEPLGITQSFGKLLSQTTDFSYYCFCDQDDLWLPNKLNMTLAALQRAENTYGDTMPLAIHTDLIVCNKNLETIQDSMKSKLLSILEKSIPLSKLIAQNYVTGCTLMINKKLREISLPIPPEALMHDWWIALIASALGKIIFVPQATLRYRQHSDNASGSALALNIVSGFKKFVSDFEAMKNLMHKRFQQSLALEKHLEKLDSSKALFFLKDFHKKLHQGSFSGVLKAYESEVFMSNFSRSLAYYFLLWKEGPSLVFKIYDKQHD